MVSFGSVHCRQLSVHYELIFRSPVTLVLLCSVHMLFFGLFFGLQSVFKFTSGGFMLFFLLVMIELQERLNLLRSGRVYMTAICFVFSNNISNSCVILLELINPLKGFLEGSLFSFLFPVGTQLLFGSVGELIHLLKCLDLILLKNRENCFKLCFGQCAQFPIVKRLQFIFVCRLD